jgi:hypothetical protein
VQATEQFDQVSLFLAVFGTCQRCSAQGFLKLRGERVIEHDSVFCELALMFSKKRHHGFPFEAIRPFE